MSNRPEYSSELQHEVEDQINPDLARLGSWLGTTLSCRDFREQVLARPLDWTVQ